MFDLFSRWFDPRNEDALTCWTFVVRFSTTTNQPMRILVTGATGFIGSALVQELREAGHQVLGLARSEAAAQALLSVGAEAHRGALDDLDRLKRGAAASAGVIHTAIVRDFSAYATAGKTDRQVGNEIRGGPS